MNYPKIYRIPVPGYRTRGKHYLTLEEVDKLLSTKVVVEEKVDGKLTPLDIFGQYTIVCEYMKYAHNIQYKSLPSTFIGLDVYLSDDTLVSNSGLKNVLIEYSNIKSMVTITRVPVIDEGTYTIDKLLKFIGTMSAYGAARIEGIVVKNYELGMYGKIVDPLFEDEVDDSEHWSDKPRVVNTIVGY